MRQQSKIGGNWERIWKDSGADVDALEIEIWDDHIGLIHTEYYDKTIELVRSADSVLEAGCGIGRWVKYLQDRGVRIVGVDLSESAARCWRMCGLRCVYADIRTLPFPNEFFNVVLSRGVLEHFQDKQEVVVALKESKRVLKQNGWMLITVPYMNALHLVTAPYRWIKGVLGRVGLLRRILGKGPHRPNPFFEHKYFRRDFESLIRQAGLQIEITKAISHEFGLLVDLPLPFFRNGPRQRQYHGVSKFGKAVAATLKCISPWLTNHQVFYVCRKSE